MSVLRRALLIGALTHLAAPAMATQLAMIAPMDPTALVSRHEAGELSPQAEAIRSILVGENASAERVLIDGVRAFYEARDFEPLWIENGRAGPKMIALRRQLDGAADDGLDPALYSTPDVMPADAGALAAADVDFSLAVVRYVTHLASGRLDPAEISRIVTLEPERPAPAEILSRLSDDMAVAEAVSQYEPPHPQYKALKAKLAELRASTAEATQVVVPEGTLLRPGKADARVPILRTRLSVAAAADTEPDIYDAVLVEAVKTFQSESGLTADGLLGPRTLVALNGPNREDDIAAIVANMERWRWMPRDLGDFHVFVNVPEFMVRVFDAGSMVHETRIVVGTPKNPTPTFSHVMDHLVVNPFWHVPASIVTNEMLPEIRQNPYGYFAKRGYQVLAKAGGKMRVVNPDSIDWWMVNPRSVQIRQVPGDHNALGRIKFMFPNQHSVYLHDTPSKKLFQRDHRAFSHGCVRVDNPLDFADAILKVAAPEWNSRRLEALYGGKEQRINLVTPIPVHLSYFTRSVDAEGELRRFEDIYGYDREMRQLLGQ